jgi:release factor glutamine methyltransferase
METVFHSISIETAPGRVFNPRPSTEALVDAALAELDGAPMQVADVGTGTGAVAIAIAKLAPATEVWATDIHPEAVELARDNVARHDLEKRVHVLEGNLLDPVPHPVDLVVANLPYLAAGTRDDPEHAIYRDEPETAIYAPGDGLGPYRGLLNACESGRLIEGGKVLIQFHRRILEADCWALGSLRERLETERTALAAG